jgi:hypothetical protein
MYCPGLLEYIRWSDRRLGMLAGVHITLFTETTSTITFSHRWARLLKQESYITVYHLPTKENKLRFPFPFAATNGSLPFMLSVCSIQTEVAVFRQFRIVTKFIISEHIRNKKHLDTCDYLHVHTV